MSIRNPQFDVYNRAVRDLPEMAEAQALRQSQDFQDELARSNQIFRDQFEPRIDAIEDQMVTRDDFSRLQPQIDEIFAEYRNFSQSEFPTMSRLESIERDLTSRGIPTSQPREFLEPYEAYRRSAGEVEARNVQTRMDMTPDQRRATPPWETQDVPDDLQIVRRGGDGPQMSVEGRAEDFDSLDLSAPRNDYEFIGFRTVEDGFDPLTPSRHWDDGIRTEQELPGVSVTDIDEKLARNMHGLEERNRRAGYYFGDRTYLVGGNKASYGEDLGELIIEDPTIIAEVMRKYGVASVAALPPAVLAGLGLTQKQAAEMDANRADTGAL